MQVRCGNCGELIEYRSFRLAPSRCPNCSMLPGFGNVRKTSLTDCFYEFGLLIISFFLVVAAGLLSTLLFRLTCGDADGGNSLGVFIGGLVILSLSMWASVSSDPREGSATLLLVFRGWTPERNGKLRSWLYTGCFIIVSVGLLVPSLQLAGLAEAVVVVIAYLLWFVFVLFPAHRAYQDWGIRRERYLNDLLELRWQPETPSADNSTSKPNDPRLKLD